MTIISTDRLILRPLRDGDGPALVRELNDFAITRNTATIPFPYADSDAADFLHHVRAWGSRSLACAVETKDAPGELIGVVSYEWSDDKQDAELGYWLSQSHWRQGLGREAAGAAVAHAFEFNRHPRLVARYHDGNRASERILLGLGFAPVGRGNSFSRAQGKEVPVAILELTADRWRGRAR